MAGIGNFSIEVACPRCGDPMTVPVSTRIAGPPAGSEVPVDVLVDELEIEAQELVCTG